MSIISFEISKAFPKEEIYSLTEGQPPEINLYNEKNNGLSILKIIDKNLATSVHDISSGGLIVALSEMSIGSSYGVKIEKPRKLTNLIKYFFGEDQSRYIIEVDKNNLDKTEKILKDDNIYYENIGSTQKDFFEVKDEFKIEIKELYKLNNKWYNNF